MGWLTNPKKAAYNRVYQRTSVDPIRLLTAGRGGRNGRSNPVSAIISIIVVIAVIVWFLG